MFADGNGGESSAGRERAASEAPPPGMQRPRHGGADGSAPRGGPGTTSPGIPLGRARDRSCRSRPGQPRECGSAHRGRARREASAAGGSCRCGSCHSPGRLAKPSPCVVQHTAVLCLWAYPALVFLTWAERAAGSGGPRAEELPPRGVARPSVASVTKIAFWLLGFLQRAGDGKPCSIGCCCLKTVTLGLAGCDRGQAKKASWLCLFYSFYLPPYRAVFLFWR